MAVDDRTLLSVGLEEGGAQRLAQVGEDSGQHLQDVAVYVEDRMSQAGADRSGLGTRHVHLPQLAW